jgi:hypothetical protein
MEFVTVMSHAKLVKFGELMIIHALLTALLQEKMNV